MVPAPRHERARLSGGVGSVVPPGVTNGRRTGRTKQTPSAAVMITGRAWRRSRRSGGVLFGSAGTSGHDIDRPLPARVTGIRLLLVGDLLPLAEVIETAADRGVVEEEVAVRRPLFRSNEPKPLVTEADDNTGGHDKEPFRLETSRRRQRLQSQSTVPRGTSVSLVQSYYTAHTIARVIVRLLEYGRISAEGTVARGEAWWR